MPRGQGALQGATRALSTRISYRGNARRRPVDADTAGLARRGRSWVAGELCSVTGSVPQASPTPASVSPSCLCPARSPRTRREGFISFPRRVSKAPALSTRSGGQHPPSSSSFSCEAQAPGPPPLHRAGGSVPASQAVVKEMAFPVLPRCHRLVFPVPVGLGLGFGHEGQRCSPGD